MLFTYGDYFEQLFESSAGEEAKRKGLKHVGYGRYADKSGKVVAKSQNDKLVPIKAMTPAPTAKPQVTSQPKQTAPAKTRNPIPKNFAEKISGAVSTKIKNPRVKKQALKFFNDFMKVVNAPSPESAAQLIKKYDVKQNINGDKIYVDSLISGDPKDTIRYDNAFEGAGGTQIVKVLSSILGDKSKTILPVKGGGEQFRAKETMKPSRLFQNKTVLPITSHKDQQGNIHSVKVGDIEYQKQPDIPIEKLESVFRKRGLKSDEAKKSAERVRWQIRSYNKKVEQLANIDKLEVVDLSKEQGKNDAEKIANAISKGMTQTSKKSKDAIQHIQELSHSKPEEFEQKWVELEHIIRKDSNLRPAYAYIAESVAAMRQAINGRKVLIPTSDKFPTADVIGINKVSIHAISDANKLSQQINYIFASIDTASVKEGAGGASSTRAKVSLTEFNHPDIKKDLVYMTDTVFRKIFYDKDPDAKTQLDRLTKKYKKSITKYYGIPESASEEKIIAMLSNGIRPKIYKGSDVPVIKGVAPVIARAKNRTSWRLYSAYMFIGEAVYNRNMNYQLYSNESYGPKGISISDGVNKVGIMRSQFVKKTRMVKSGDEMPDIGFSSHIVNGTRDKLETGYY